MTVADDVKGMSRDRLEQEVEDLREKLESASMAMAGTARSWEDRCHSIVAALGMDFGGPTPDMPEQGSYHARAMTRLRKENFDLSEEAFKNSLDAKRWRALTENSQLEVSLSFGIAPAKGNRHLFSKDGQGFSLSISSNVGDDVDPEKHEEAVRLLTGYADHHRVRRKNAQ